MITSTRRIGKKERKKLIKPDLVSTGVQDSSMQNSN